MKKGIILIVVLVLVLGMGMPAEAETDYHSASYVYLTFDDGPDERTPAILDVLKKQKVKATFFVTGRNAKRYPTLLKRIVKEGHAIGLHSMTHDAKLFYKTPASAVAEMKETQVIVTRLTGKKVYDVRVPYGSVPKMTPEHIKKMEAAGFRIWDWNVDSEDWRYAKRPEVTFERVALGLERTAERKTAAVVLMHDHATNPIILEKWIVSEKKKAAFRTVLQAKTSYSFFAKWPAKK